MQLHQLTLTAAAVLLLACPTAAGAFPKEAAPAKECAECHTLTREEAGKLLGKVADNVIGVVPGPFPGIWEVDVEKGGKKYPLYLDYSGKYLFNGQVVRLGDMQNLTALRFTDLNRVDFSSIPLGDAVVLGNPKANTRVIVFDDPDCPWCKKLHGEIKQVVARDPDVAFFVLLYSRNNNPASVQKVRSIVCGKKNAAKLLDDAFAGKELPSAACQTNAAEDSAKLARGLGIQGTPALVLSDGRLIPGYRTADALLALIRPQK
jgi:thiol:disulfide interchange protein DsbC